MLRVTKVSEYGVLALGFVGQASKAVSAREISEGLKLPFDITAKTLQKLKDAGFVSSLKGINGGYLLTKHLDEISFANVIEALEGSPSVVECIDTNHQGCERIYNCQMRNSMQKLNEKIWTLFREMKLSELVGQKSPLLSFGEAGK